MFLGHDQAQRGPALDLDNKQGKNGKPAEVKEFKLDISEYVSSSRYTGKVSSR